MSSPTNSSQHALSPTFAPHATKELSFKAIVVGSLFSMLFGVSSVYLALRTGLTVGGAISIAVITVGVVKYLGKTTLLENNIIQTIGSISESIASGLVFRLAGLVFLVEGTRYFRYTQLITIVILGELLGLFLIIPLRHNLIVKEHHVLPYPEAVACAEVLHAGEKKGTEIRPVLWGFLASTVYWILMGLLGLWNTLPQVLPKALHAIYPNATLAIEATPEYAGIGYIIGPKTTRQMMIGGVLMWLVLIPLFSAFPKLAGLLGAKDVVTTLLDLGVRPQNVLSPTAGDVYKAYGRFIGMGAVVCAGLITLIKTIPLLIKSFRQALPTSEASSQPDKSSTGRDVPMPVVLGGVFLVLVLLMGLPQLPWKFPGSIVVAVLIVVFGLFFVGLSSRFVGIMGYSMDPVTSMMFTTVMAACVVFIALRWTTPAHQPVVLLIGATVCLAAGNAGASSQALKTGFLVGATPWKQQVGLGIGVLVSAVSLSGAILLIDHSIPSLPHLIGTLVPGEQNIRYPAPQASLVALLIKALLSGKIPLGLVAFGAALALVAHLGGFGGVLVASGLYFPISTTFTLFLGGVIRWMVSRRETRTGQTGARADSDFSVGMLCATGLVAGGALSGMALGLFQGFFEENAEKMLLGHKYWLKIGVLGDWISIACFAAVCWFLYKRATSRPRKVVS